MSIIEINNIANNFIYNLKLDEGIIFILVFIAGSVLALKTIDVIVTSWVNLLERWF